MSKTIWRILAISIGLAAVFFYDSSASAQTGATVRVVALTVALPDPGSEYGGSYVLGRPAGVDVSIMVEDRNAFFLAVVDEGSEKTEVQLLAGGKPLENENRFSRLSFMSNISDNGQRVIVPISATELPPKGTTGLKAAGKLVLKVGDDEKVDKVAFKVAQGETVQLGPVAAKIASVESYDFGAAVTNVTFESTKPLDAISSIKFLDENGKEIETSPGGSSAFGFGDQMTYSRGFGVAGKPTSLTAEVKFFSKTRNVIVPIDVEVDLSLGGK